MPFNRGSNKMKNAVIGQGGLDLGATTSRQDPNQGLSSYTPKNKLTALVVDDNKVNRKIHKMLLTNLGVKSEEAENGQEAVNLCALGIIFDLILIDMEMPVMDGPQATRIMREIGVRSKIVGVSGNSRSDEKQSFMEAGIDEFYEKPMTRAKLISLVQEIDNR
ncbi:two-component response regulator 24-like [Tasmannia lanceolata]|uniref:two-component response regulator 24-like n=1 Tax=Tasmannia lanceolata TaxID=3420 RepID=UPI0040639617